MSVVRPTIGIVDDEASMRDALVVLLQEHQFNPIPMASVSEFNNHDELGNLDLVLIDLQLNDESGLALAVDIRRNRDLPIVMLTGRGDETDKIVGLEIGADDYLLKPFNPRELVARIRAVLRRYGKSEIAAPIEDDQTSVFFGTMTLNKKHRVLFDEIQNEIPLSNAEYRLLDYFLERPNIVVTRVELLSELGNDLTKYVDRTIDVLILRLRRKIEKNPSKPVHLQTRRGQGYIFIKEQADRR